MDQNAILVMVLRQLRRCAVRPPPVRQGQGALAHLARCEALLPHVGIASAPRPRVGIFGGAALEVELAPGPGSGSSAKFPLFNVIEIERNFLNFCLDRNNSNLILAT